MKSGIDKVPGNRKAQYETPKLSVHGSFESVTRQDGDGRRFDMSFNAGDIIPPSFSS